MLNPMDLTGRLMLVTGASSGIGRETAILLSQLGARVVLVARNPAGLEQTRSLLEGPDHRVEPRDLAALNDIPGWLQGLSRELGAFSGLVAGLGRLLSLEVGTPVRTVLRRLILRWGGGPIIIPDQSRLSDRRPSDGGRWHRVMAGVVAYILGRAMDRAAAAPQQCQQTDGT